MKKTVINIRALLAAVINRAIDDLKGIGPKCRRKETDLAMAFILSDCCECWCLELDIDYKTIREKAASLYRRIIEKEAPGNARGKTRRKARKRLQAHRTRQRARGTHVIATGR